MASGELAIAEAVEQDSEAANTVFFLIKKLHSSLDARDSNGSTAFHHAARRNLLSLMKILVKEGADPNMEDGTGQTAWEIACSLAYPHLAEYLGRCEDWETRMDELRSRKTYLGWSLVTARQHPRTSRVFCSEPD